MARVIDYVCGHARWSPLTVVGFTHEPERELNSRVVYGKSLGQSRNNNFGSSSMQTALSSSWLELHSISFGILPYRDSIIILGIWMAILNLWLIVCSKHTTTPYDMVAQSENGTQKADNSPKKRKERRERDSESALVRRSLRVRAIRQVWCG